MHINMYFVFTYVAFVLLKYKTLPDIILRCYSATASRPWPVQNWRTCVRWNYALNMWVCVHIWEWMCVCMCVCHLLSCRLSHTFYAVFCCLTRAQLMRTHEMKFARIRSCCRHCRIALTLSCAHSLSVRLSLGLLSLCECAGCSKSQQQHNSFAFVR